MTSLEWRREREREKGGVRDGRRKETRGKGEWD